MDTQRIDEAPQPLAKLIGVEIVEATKARVVGRLVVRPEICTTFDTTCTAARSWRSRTRWAPPALS